MKTESIITQPLAWVIATLFHPECKELLVFVVSPLSHKKVHKVNIHGHPDETTVAVPLLSPTHVGEASSPNKSANGSGKVIVVVSKHPVESVTCNQYDPADKFWITGLVLWFDHMYVWGLGEFEDKLILKLPSDEPLQEGKVLLIPPIILPGQQGVRFEL